MKSPEAHVLLLSAIAHAKLVYGDLEGTKTDMDAAWKVLDTLEGVEGTVNAAYYGVAADYYKVNILPLGIKLDDADGEVTGKSGVCAVLPQLTPLPCMRRS